MILVRFSDLHADAHFFRRLLQQFLHVVVHLPSQQVLSVLADKDHVEEDEVLRVATSVVFLLVLPGLLDRLLQVNTYRFFRRWRFCRLGRFGSEDFVKV